IVSRCSSNVSTRDDPLSVSRLLLPPIPASSTAASGRVAVLLAQHLLVELADTCFSKDLDEDDLLRHAIFRNDAFIALGHHMRFEIVVAHRRLGLRIAHYKRERALSPPCILDPDHSALLLPGPM